jgi:hypothetical protein
MEGEAVAKVAKKRAVKKVNNYAQIAVTKNGDHFVCALTGLLCDKKAIVTPSYPAGAFYDLTALLRHAETNLSGEKYGPLRAVLSREFHQPQEVMLACAAPLSIPVSPADIATVFRSREMWSAHTVLHGLSVAEFDELASAKAGAAKKAKPEKPAVYSFEVGAYVIKPQRGGDVKLAQADGNAVTANAVKSQQNKDKCPEGCHSVVVLNGDYTIWAITPKPEINADQLPEEVKATVNLLATQLLGALAYGTAVVLSHKKQTFKAQ